MTLNYTTLFVGLSLAYSILYTHAFVASPSINGAKTYSVQNVANKRPAESAEYNGRSKNFRLYPQLARRHYLQPETYIAASANKALSPSSLYSSIAHSSGITSLSSSTNGLSRFHHSILSRKVDRQRFFTGRYPLTVSIKQDPTRKWLRQGSQDATTEILVNNTVPLRSLASLDRLHWLDNDERQDLLDSYAMISLEFIAEIHVDRPGYLHVLPGHGAGSSMSALRQSDGHGWNRWRTDINKLISDKLSVLDTPKDRLWVTGFCITKRQGTVTSIDCNGEMNSINKRSSNQVLWPNEASNIPVTIVEPSSTADQQKMSLPRTNQATYQDAILVADGFLVPGRDRGGIYVVKNPGNPQSEWTISLTGSRDAVSSTNDRWFYHRAVWVDLTGDGRQSILTARCQISPKINTNNEGVTSGITKKGELVWLECPKPFSYDPETGTPLDEDGTHFDPFDARHLPWKCHVLADGPDVMMCVADMNVKDDTIEVISSQFFDQKVVLYSIQKGKDPKVVYTKVIDDNCGSAFGCILANLDCLPKNYNDRQVVDAGSTVTTLQASDPFSHLLVTNHEHSSKDIGANNESSSVRSKPSDGGSLFAYKVPQDTVDAWKTQPWSRSTIASGFKVASQLTNMMNPGAPGFVYTFHAKRNYDPTQRPMIAVAGDCAESAFLFRPAKGRGGDMTSRDPSTNYKLMVEFKCGATVGSIGVGYDDFTDARQESDYAKLFIPCYEKDKVLVFALGSGDDDDADDGGW